MIDLSKPLDTNDPDAKEFLAGVQGNIIKSHGRDHTAHVFLTFPAAYQPVRKWIGTFASSGQLTTAADQQEQTARFKATPRGPGEPFAAFLLSHAGYQTLGLSDRAPADGFFRAGLKQHNTVNDPINDPDPGLWEPGYRGDVHAMLLLADDDRPRLDATAARCVGELQALGVSTFVERGDKLRYDFGPPRGLLEIEHFGHQDGISNPQVTVQDIAKEVKGRGSDRWDPSAPLDLVLVVEAGTTASYGSYMVFRKLEQNVRAFAAARNALAALLHVDQDGAGALMVGRRRDGTPAIPTMTLMTDADPNNFNYSQDAPSVRGTPARLCPFHAHIRRTNPRGDIARYIGGTDAFERSMRIMRRGITYGERPHLYGTEPWALPETGVGLLFMCFQKDLRQFAIQQSGSDDQSFPFVGPAGTQFSGLESVVGQGAPGATVRPQPWPYRDSNDDKAVREYKMMNFVKMLGGEYFFAPSPSFLRGLAGQT